MFLLLCNKFTAEQQKNKRHSIKLFQNSFSYMQGEVVALFFLLAGLQCAANMGEGPYKIKLLSLQYVPCSLIEMTYFCLFLN